MRFHALEVALDIIVRLREVLPVIRRRDTRLATQIRDAASSVALNLGEGHRRLGRDRGHLFSIASGSAEEVRSALRVAVAWGYLGESRIDDVLKRVDEIQAMLWRLTR